MSIPNADFLSDFRRRSANWLPGQSVDCVIFGFDKGRLKVLLNRWRGQSLWGLPGGFIELSEDLDTAAHRVLSERTGLDSVYLDQFYTFGDPARQPIDRLKAMLVDFGIDVPEVLAWFGQRFITTGYFALVNIKEVKPQADALSDACQWHALHELPPLVLDHRDIIMRGLQHVRIQLNYLPVSRSLLPTKFTMRELQNLYEEILGEKLDRANFQRKMLKLGIFVRLDKRMSGGAHKAPFEYRFDIDKYEALLSQGIGYIH